MKATQREFRQAAPLAARDGRVFFFCGPDEAGASAAAQAIVDLLDESGERVELSGSELRFDPVLLADEARSSSLFGGTRHIWVRASGDEAHDAVKNLLDTFDAGEGEGACPVLIVATSATDKARTAKLIARACGLDLRLARSEVEKLALYCDASPQSPVTLGAAALDAIGASTEEDGFMPLVNAVLSGDAGAIPGEFRRMRELSLNPVGLLLAFERRAAQLAQLAARLGRSERIGPFIDAEKAARRVFFRDAPELKVQLAHWRGRRLERLVQRLAETHRALLANSQSAETLLAQELAEIGRNALPDKRNR